MKTKPSKRDGAIGLHLNRPPESRGDTAAAEQFQLNRILIPIDFSDCATKALRYALPLAAQHGATLVLLYVVPTPAYGFGENAAINFEALTADMCATGKKALRALASAEVGKRVRCEIAVRNGSPSVEITDFARALPADLIVISTHGYTGISRILLGSVAEHVVRQAPCPVLVVREREHEFLRS